MLEDKQWDVETIQRTLTAIALITYAAELDQQKALQQGFQTQITKLVKPEAFVKAIV